MRLIAYTASALLLASALAGCGQSDQQQDSANTLKAMSGQIADPAPEYEEPSMDQLQGKPQPFPSRYPLTQYPKSKVALAWVKRDLKPGWKNQVMLKSEDEILRISAYYHHELSTKGWKQVRHYETLSYNSTTWQKDGQEIEVRVTPDQFNNRNVQLLAGPILQAKLPIDTKVKTQ